MAHHYPSGSSMPYRQLGPTLEGEAVFERFLGDLAERLDDPTQARDDTIRATIAELYGVRLNPGVLDDESLPVGLRALYASFDPRNITLEPEYYADIDREQYARVKPLTWLWIMFDRSPMGQNAYLGHRLRRLLAQRIFKRCGRNVKIWHFVEYTYGYNLSVGDDVVLHRYAFLDDRGGLELGNRVSVSDYANIYSHTHDVNDISRVFLHQTRVADHARITYHATVLAGADIGKDGMLGAMALATKPVPEYHVSAGIPAHPVRPKDHPCPSCAAEAEAGKAVQRNRG